MHYFTWNWLADWFLGYHHCGEHLIETIIIRKPKIILSAEKRKSFRTHHIKNLCSTCVRILSGLPSGWHAVVESILLGSEHMSICFWKVGDSYFNKVVQIWVELVQDCSVFHKDIRAVSPFNGEKGESFTHMKKLSCHIFSCTALVFIAGCYWR